MRAVLRPGVSNKNSVIPITGSKSESNRLLILQALYPAIGIKNLSNSDDTAVLRAALSGSFEGVVDIHHAGTAMRFLTAFFAVVPGTMVELTGSSRMKQRPIAILVEALRTLGADIEYLETDGFPPLMIKGKQLVNNQVHIEANTSSQYISALLLVAPSLKNGLNITMEGEITSQPYIEMTCNLLAQIGVDVVFSEGHIRVKPMKNASETTVNVESDWSSASYFFSLVALSENHSVTLENYKKDSFQGDAELVFIYEAFGIETAFHSYEERLTISNSGNPTSEIIKLDLSSTPDIAQTIAVTCFGLGLQCELRGLHTLKIKETDRLIALKTEIEKLGGKMDVTHDSLKLYPSQGIKSDVTIETYDDHRMAMAFAPLALKTELTINDSEVVGKSFPDFWRAIGKMGVIVEIKI